MPSVSHCRAQARGGNRAPPAAYPCADGAVRSTDNVLGQGQRPSAAERANEASTDLLGRDPVSLDDAGLHGFLDGRTVLVTGAGGSIGAELCRPDRALRAGAPGALELPNSRCTRSSRSSATAIPRSRSAPVIGDAKDEARVEAVFARYRPTWCSTPRPTSTCR
jgi:FlaA1/EpsC-like NDP-sugar epimerase